MLTSDILFTPLLDDFIDEHARFQRVRSLPWQEQDYLELQRIAESLNARAEILEQLNPEFKFDRIQHP